jgi:hypothetical protein
MNIGYSTECYWVPLKEMISNEGKKQLEANYPELEDMRLYYF